MTPKEQELVALIRSHTDFGCTVEDILTKARECYAEHPEPSGENLFVIHKPIHDPFGYYRENAHGYTTVENAWRVPLEVAKKYASGRPEDPDRVIVEPARQAPACPKCARKDAALVQCLKFAMGDPTIDAGKLAYQIKEALE